MTKAFVRAVAVHKEQIYGIDKPYTYHLKQVVNEVTGHKDLIPANVTYAQMVQAAWLHDAVEDTPLTVEEVEEEFGPIIADLVERVTNKPGKNRKERHANTYPRLVESEGAVFLKMCDRLANLKACKQPGNKNLIGMYRKEHKAFKAIFGPVAPPSMMQELETLIK